MIILDNSVLSAFTRLNLLSHLKEIFSPIIISKDILGAYSEHWQKKISIFVKIIEPREDIEFRSFPVSLNPADLSIIRLGLEYKFPIASDDKKLRKFAKRLDIPVIGSLGLLKLLFKNKIIKTDDEYVKLLESLQEDLYISAELLNWAIKDMVEEEVIKKFMDKYNELK
ncbi:MAG: hypothetical protein EU549_00745 [Promethearchaeota archaeon]|nr:MAG: hypothetical protein EU549_00745 [Candidatus Lokiarchaeota archaeon]